MTQSIDDKFNDIIQTAIGQACDINCPAEEYRENLKIWIDEIRTAIAASEDSDDMNLNDSRNNDDD